MHKSSYLKMKWFKNNYLDNNTHLNILDIGSFDNTGNFNYGQLFNEPNWDYTGLDVKEGYNVDIVLEDIYDWSSIEDDSYDVVVSGQFFEHLEYYWVVMDEIKRVLKPGGYVCIIAPSGGPNHGSLPVYNKFYEDTFKKLANYVDLDIVHISTNFNATPWCDSCLVAQNCNPSIFNNEDLNNKLCNLDNQVNIFLYLNEITNLLNNLEIDKFLSNSNELTDIFNSLYVMSENIKSLSYDLDHLTKRFNQFEMHANKSFIEVPKNVKKLNSLNNQFNSYKKDTESVLNSNNTLFNSLFLDYKLVPKKPLKNIQDLCCQLLLFVDNISKKYDLKWWLDYGSLLGAVRHNDFIPWDDDIDTGMIRKDYIKFKKIINEEIINNNLEDIIKVSYYQRKNVDSFMQIFVMHKTKDYGNTIFAGVDVFPYDYLNNFDKSNFEDLYYKSKLKFLSERNNGIDEISALKNYYNSLNLNISNGRYIIPGIEGACGPNNLYKLLILEHDKLFPLKNIKFNNFLFPCPNDSDYHLKFIYDNYESIPKNIRAHSRVRWFRLNSLNDKFESDINRLKEVNNNF